MKRPNITTGPWEAYPPNEATDLSEYWEVEDTAGHTATVYGNDSEGEANARAIAALPELLAALEKIENELADIDLPFPSYAREALTKAV